MGWQSVRVKKLSGVSNVPSLLFRSNVKRGQAIQQIDLPESQESGTRTCGKQSGTRASIVLQPKLRALAAGKSSFITSSEDLPRE
jgi:hypothetical protein